MTLTVLAPEVRATTIPPELDPRLASYVKTQVKRLRLLSGSQRAFLVLERYPELRKMPLVDWERLSYWPAYSVLYGAASHHFARLQLAALQGILLWTGATPHYLRLTDTSIRHTLELVRRDFNITTPADLTFDLWERLARDTDLVRTKHQWIRWYISVVQRHILPYMEQLTNEETQRIEHLLLPLSPNTQRRPPADTSKAATEGQVGS